MKAVVKANIGTDMVKELNLAAVYREGQSYDLPESDYEALSKIGLIESVPSGTHAVASPVSAKQKKVSEEVK